MTDVVLETRDLARHFVTARPLFGPPTVVRAVDGVTLAVRRGETFAIVGESGCGKSTLARLMIGLLAPTSGQALHRGDDLGRLAPAALRARRRDLQFIFQDPFASLNPRMTVGRIVGEPIRAHRLGGDVEGRVAALLARVGLRPEHAARFPHEFSGGQRQRIGIARALASGPSVLVGDEPVSALDVSIQAQVLNLLGDLRAELGLTLVIISHDLGVIRHMSDRVAVMYLGEIVETGPAEAVMDAPLHPYAQALVAAAPRPRAGARAVAAPRGEPPSPTAPPPGCRFHPRCPHATERCRTAAPMSEAAGPGRFVACHHWRAIAAAGASAPVAPPALSAATRARFDLYRAAVARRETAPPTPTPMTTPTKES